MVAEWYGTHGYNFLALSDHNILSPGERWIEYRQVVQRGGESVQAAIRANLRAAEDQALRLGREFLVHVNHPNFHSAITAEDLAAVIEQRFFEVYNGPPDVHHLGDATRPSVEQIWDIANTPRTMHWRAAPLVGVASDDRRAYHGLEGSTPAEAG